MSEISDYETRIATALERIGQAVAKVEDQVAQAGQGGIASEEMATEMGRLQETLEGERETNAQLEGRVKAIHQTQLNHVASLEEEVEGLRNQLMVHDGEIQKLRRVNTQLRSNSSALRDVHTSAVSDPALINNALIAELESMQASRDADVAELGAIRNELRPFIATAQSTPEET